MLATKKTPSKPASRSRATAETMAGKQRDISVSEFFAKNRHLLGFDNPRKALLTTVKEAVDNALDACEEAGILPDIEVLIEELSAPPSTSKPGRYAVTITDNGPGIVRKQVENIFGRLLYGSKFHRMKMSRGQQGIGISAAGMYGLMTTGKPMVITTKPGKRKAAHHLELAMDTTKNKPEVTIDVETDDFPETSSGTGTRVRIEMEARYQRGKTSVEAYLEQTAIANPHAQITFIPPEKAAGGPALEVDDVSTELSHTTELADRYVFPRAVEELPPETEEIKPHPYGVELGNFLRMLKSTNEKQLTGFFKNEFSRVPPAIVKDVTAKATTKGKTLTGQTYVKTVDHDAAERLYRALQDSKLRAPPTDCLAPIGVRQMLSGLLKGVKAEFYAASTRDPAVYRGNPFQIEAAIAFGGDLPGDEPARVIRFANRVPLLYQQSACCSFKAVVETGWKNYSLSQPRGALPVGPMVIMVHMASVWVPFTSESKEAIADYDEIRKEMRLALQECGRKLGTYLRRRQKMRREGQRRDVFARYIAEIARSTSALTGEDEGALLDALLKQAQARTAIADAELDEDGNFVKKDKGASDDDGVIIVDSESRPSQVEAKSNGQATKAAESDAGRGLFGGDEESVPVRRKKNGKKTGKKVGKKTSVSRK
ncbi:MAG: DNA topoisomerase VI subunit B [Phycisphaerales bacterium]|jgi:DNA topoisomerase-6 subunit B